MADTNVPAIQFTSTGVVVPTEAAILAGRQADLNAAFGGGVNPKLTTSQGQVAQTETAIIAAKNDAVLFVANNVDPAYASGRMQDAIARIYFLEREPAQSTAVSCVCVGLASTSIPTGALATDGVNLWTCVAGGTIPMGGSITLPFACTVTGPVACPAHAVSRIFQTIPGWDTIDNPAPGVTGSVVESRADFEHRRQQSVSKNSLNTTQAVRGQVLNVPGVLDAYAYQNDTASAATVGGVSIAKNSLYVCAAGGDPQAIAQAIWSKKSPGCGYTGTTSRTVLDTNGYSVPYPSYTVQFQVASALPILFAVSIVSSVLVPSDAVTQIQNAVVAAFNGVDGGPRARIGSTVFASRFYAGISALGAWAQVISVLIGTTTPTANSVTVNIDRIPTVIAANIAVTLV